MTSNTAAPGETVSLSLTYQHETAVVAFSIVIQIPGETISDVDISDCGGGSVSCSLSSGGQIFVDDFAPFATTSLGKIRLTVSNDVSHGTSIPINIVSERYDGLSIFDIAAYGSYSGNILVASAKDQFEPDNQALAAGLVMGGGPMWRVQNLTGRDEDWLAFENLSPCSQTSTWQMYSQSADTRFRPVIEVFDFDRLTNPTIPPRARFDGCGQTATVFPYNTFSFVAEAQGLWRITNCPDVPLKPTDSLRYVLVQGVDSVQCRETGRIEGQVVYADSGLPVTGIRMFVETDENEVTPVSPVDGSFGLGVNSAIPGGGQIQVALWPIAASFDGSPLVQKLTDTQILEGVMLPVRLIDGLFLNGFE
ncbi:MAG: hypothetical protein AB8B96_01800 [Lysobacterales bacterium]